MTSKPGSADVSVRIVRRFHVPPARVYDAWLDPARLARWMFGPDVRDERIVHLRLEPRVGGRFSFRVLRGGGELEHDGEYLVLDRPHRLCFTWAAYPAGTPRGEDSRVEIAIVADGAGCELTLVHTMAAKWADYAARTEHGWSTMLDALAARLDPDAHGARTRREEGGGAGL